MILGKSVKRTFAALRRTCLRLKFQKQKKHIEKIMLKKSLLIGSAVLLASSPLLVASDWTQDPRDWNTILCGTWTYNVTSENYRTISFSEPSKTATANI